MGGERRGDIGGRGAEGGMEGGDRREGRGAEGGDRRGEIGGRG